MKWQTENSSLLDQREINVTVLYENLKADIRARTLLGSIQSEMTAAAVQIKPELWRFDWLKEPSAWGASLRAARDSVLLMISASSNEPLSDEMERWLSEWSGHRESHPSALIALFSNELKPPLKSHPVVNRLQWAACLKDADFLCEFVEFSEAGESLSWIKNETPKPRLQTPTRRFGLKAAVPLGGGARRRFE